MHWSPLLFEAEQLGTEILYPVAVVIFSRQTSSTLLLALAHAEHGQPKYGGVVA